MIVPNWSGTIPVVNGNADSAHTGEQIASGGDADLGWSATGLDTGDELIISTNGVHDFGSKAQAAPVLWDHGTEVYENGVKSAHRESAIDSYVVEDNSVNNAELYDNASGVKLVTTSRVGRHAQSQGHYAQDQASHYPFVDAPMAQGVNVPEHNQHYLSFYIKYGMHFQKIHVIDYTNKSGTFQAPDLVADPDALGEQLTLNNAEEAYLLLDTGTELCFYTPNTTDRQTVLANTSIMGVTSGASCLVTDGGVYTDDHSGPEKIVRVWSEDDGNSGFRYTWSRYQSDLTGTPNVLGSTGDINENGAGEGQWALMELLIDISTNTLIVACEGNILSQTDFSAYTGNAGVWDKTKGLRQRAIGWQAVRTLYNSVEFGEIYLDHTSQRVFIGDASTWGACTKREIQRPKQWGAAQVTVILNKGALSQISGNYIYIIDGGYPAPNLEGLQIL